MNRGEKKSLRQLTKSLRPSASDAGLTGVDMVVLVILSARSVRDPARLADQLGMRERKVQAAWSALRDRALDHRRRATRAWGTARNGCYSSRAHIGRRCIYGR